METKVRGNFDVVDTLGSTPPALLMLIKPFLMPVEDVISLSQVVGCCYETNTRIRVKAISGSDELSVLGFGLEGQKISLATGVEMFVLLLRSR